MVAQAPLFTFPSKSDKNTKLDVVQQCMNTWFDRALAVNHKWDYHPLATAIENSKLAADFHKTFPNMKIQAEVQFGNMSRWYSDIFKLQTAYAQSLVNIGLSIVPKAALAVRVGSNIASYERVIRELPSANLSITLPILVIGVEPDENTTVVDLSQIDIPMKDPTKTDSPAKFTEQDRYRIVNALFAGQDPHAVTRASAIGPMPKSIVRVPDEEDDAS